MTVSAATDPAETTPSAGVIIAVVVEFLETIVLYLIKFTSFGETGHMFT